MIGFGQTTTEPGMLQAACKASMEGSVYRERLAKRRQWASPIVCLCAGIWGGCIGAAVVIASAKIAGVL